MKIRLPLKCLALLVTGLLFVLSEAQAQSRTVKGKVTDEADQSGLPGVTVKVKNSSTATQTDVNGEYSIQIASENDILVYSFVGSETREVRVGNQSTIDVSLKNSDSALDELVVVGYGTMKRSEVTSAVATVTAKDFNPGGVRSPLDLIQGKVAGLNISRPQGNNPNSSAAIQLRGVTSISGSQQPLIVIDGIPGGNLDLLQQDDIQSFDVLKDGSAAAIYGTQANAGVIIITTKRAKGGPPHFDYSTYVQREYVDRKPEYLSAQDFRGLIAQGLVNSSQDLGSSTDLYDELIDKSNLSQYHLLAASGGNEKNNYRASVYFNDANGIAKNNGRQQFGGRANVYQKGFNDKLTFNANVAFNFNKADLLGGNTGDFEQAVQRNPTAPLLNADGSFVETQAYNNYNPLSRLANRINERDQQTMSVDAKLSYNIIKDLDFSTFVSYVRNNYNGRFYRSTNDWDQRLASDYRGMALAEKSNALDYRKNLEAVLNYRKQLSSRHTVSGLLGYSYLYVTNESFFVNNNGFTTDGFLDWNLGAGGAINNTLLPRPGMGSGKEDNTLIAFFGRLNYSFDDKYFAQAVLRREGSSRFGENNKWGNFPAVSVGWHLGKEEFIKNISAISNLKLRVGYGVTGNQGIPNYQSLVTLSTGGVYPQNGVYYQTYGPGRNPNPNLRWEQKQEINFGLDFGLFQNRLTGSIDVYNRTTKDLLYNYNAQQPAFVTGSIYTNVGSVRSRGIELQASTRAMTRGDFAWNIDFVGSYLFENKLTQLSNDVFKANFLEFYGLPSPGNLGNAFRLQEGGNVGDFFGKRFAGFTEDGKWLFYKADGTTARAGEMNNEDLTVIGNGNPRLHLALNNSFIYKNFDLSIFLRGQFLFDILNTKELYFGNKKWLPNNLLSSAVTTHDQLNDDPQYSDYYLEKGGFLKLDNVSVGYNMKFDSRYFRTLRVYVTGRNLLTFTKYSGIDPELSSTGFEPGVDGRGFYPRTKSFTVGLNVGF